MTSMTIAKVVMVNRKIAMDLVYSESSWESYTSVTVQPLVVEFLVHTFQNDLWNEGRCVAAELDDLLY